MRNLALVARILFLRAEAQDEPAALDAEEVIEQLARIQALLR